MDEAETRQTHRSLLLTVDVFTFGFITLISLIAVANVFNTISTGVLLYKLSCRILSIIFSPFIRLLAYIIVANTTRNTLPTAIKILMYQRARYDTK